MKQFLQMLIVITQEKNTILVIFFDCFCYNSYAVLNYLFPLTSITYMWCVTRFGTICAIQKTWKTPMEECYKVAGLLKVTVVHGCFSRFLNCTHGIKSRKTSHVYLSLTELTLCCPTSFMQQCVNSGFTYDVPQQILFLSNV